MLSKETFCDAVRELQRAWDYQEGLNEYFSNNGVDGYVYQPDCSETLIRVIEESMGLPIDDEIGSDLAYFCWELDFGRKFKPGDVTTVKNGKEINEDFSCAESLYDFLTRDEGVTEDGKN
jgi:hypothetical protein